MSRTPGGVGDSTIVFLCHASEDKTTIVEPVRDALEAAGISCWYDEAEIRWGDRLVPKIEEGIRSACYVLVFLSPAFLGKSWANTELDAALNLEASSGQVRVLALLCGTPAERSAALETRPILAGKRYVEWTGDTEVIVEALKSRLS